MKKESITPYSGIDRDAGWGYSHTKNWMFGYKLYMICSTDLPTVVPLSADVIQQPTYLTNLSILIWYHVYLQKR